MGGNRELEEGPTLKLDWSKLDKVASKKCDVVPVVVQDSRSGRVLILAYANETALSETFKRGVCCLWSTSRNELWVKGATSGDTLDLDGVFINCEQNSLLYTVTPRRTGACHTKDANGISRVSCYYRRVVQSEECPRCDEADRALQWLSLEHVSASTRVSLWSASLLAASAAIVASLATASLLRRRSL